MIYTIAGKRYYVAGSIGQMSGVYAATPDDGRKYTHSETVLGLALETMPMSFVGVGHDGKIFRANNLAAVYIGVPGNCERSDLRAVMDFWTQLLPADRAGEQCDNCKNAYPCRCNTKDVILDLTDYDRDAAAVRAKQAQHLRDCGVPAPTT